MWLLSSGRQVSAEDPRAALICGQMKHGLEGVSSPTAVLTISDLQRCLESFK